MRRTYTDAERVQALAALAFNRGNIKATARQLGIPHPTLTLWRNRAEERQQYGPPPATDYGQLYEDVEAVVLNRLVAMIPAATSLPDLTRVAALAADRHLDWVYDPRDRRRRN